MVYQVRAVTNLYEEIFGKIVKEHISADMGALRLPIQPYRTVAAINLIVSDLCIQRCMKLNACHFCTVENTLMMNIINRIAFNDTERTTQMSYHTGLLTIMNNIVSYNMATDRILIPITLQSM